MTVSSNLKYSRCCIYNICNSQLFPVKSIGGVAFITSIIGLFSCKVWVFFLFKVFAKLLLVSMNFFSKKVK